MRMIKRSTTVIGLEGGRWAFGIDKWKNPEELISFFNNILYFPLFWFKSISISMWKLLPITLNWKHTFETDYCDCFSVPLAKLMDCTRFQPIVGVTLFSYRFGKEQLFSSHGRRTSTRAWRCGALFQQLISKYLSTQLGLGYLPTEGSTWSGYNLQSKSTALFIFSNFRDGLLKC